MSLRIVIIRRLMLRMRKPCFGNCRGIWTYHHHIQGIQGHSLGQTDIDKYFAVLFGRPSRLAAYASGVYGF